MNDGLLLISKPGGMTSNDVLARLKRKLGRRDIGHGGTLDSFATGVLPVFIGEGLKTSRFFLEYYPMLPTYWKSYTATMKLGIETAALEPTTAVTARADVPLITLQSLESVLSAFRGKSYEQMPPDYSAKKIDGKRASDRVRAGESIELKTSTAEIKSLDGRLTAADEINFSVVCSKGTYIRALARDMARQLGTVAHLTMLERTAVGDFSIEQCIDLESAVVPGAGFVDLLKTIKAVMPVIEVSSDDATLVWQGRGMGVLEKLAHDLVPSAYALVSNTRPVCFMETRVGATPLLLRCFSQV